MGNRPTVDYVKAIKTKRHLSVGDDF